MLNHNKISLLCPKQQIFQSITHSNIPSSAGQFKLHSFAHGSILWTKCVNAQENSPFIYELKYYKSAIFSTLIYYFHIVVTEKGMKHMEDGK